MSASDDECKHGIVPADCTLCNGRSAAPWIPEVGPIFLARYDTRCGACDRSMEGEMVRYVDDILMHADCVGPNIPKVNLL